MRGTANTARKPAKKQPKRLKTARRPAPIAHWRAKEASVWAPPERLSTSEWAEKYRILGPPAEEKGPLRLRRTPYLRPIMDAFDDPEIETVVLCKSAQIAGTEAMLSVIGKYASEGGNPIMVVLADEDTAIYTAEKRIHPMLRTSPALMEYIIESKLNQDEISLANDSYIAMAWASSVAKLASRPIRIVVFDEVDKPGYNLSTKEGDAIGLGIERTESFYNRKIGILSTPTIETGNVSRELASCDVVFDWHVPCPYCGTLQPLRWGLKYSAGCIEGSYRGEDGQMHPVGRVTWEGGRTATHAQIAVAAYECGTCKAHWSTLEKNQAVERGKMVPRTAIESGAPLKKVGFHINRLYSLLGKSGDLAKLVREWIKAVNGNDPRKVQGFINSTLAEPYKNVVAAGTETTILQARVASLAPQMIPEAAVCLTAGIDVQKLSRWFAVRAWAPDYTSWLIDYGQLETWEDVEDLLFNKIYIVAGSETHPDGPRGKKIWRAAVDTGGTRDDETGISMTDETELWVRSNMEGRGCRVWGTKGASSPFDGFVKIGKARDKTPSGKPLQGGLQIIGLNTDRLKDQFHYRLSLAIKNESGGAYLHSGTDAQYAAHILAEEKQTDRAGRETWVRVRRRNDLLDCECMAAACVDSGWPGGGLNLLIRGNQRVMGRTGARTAGRRVISQGVGG